MSTKKVKALIDSYAALVLERQELDHELSTLRPSIVALGIGEHTGREHRLVVDQSTRASISVAVAKAYLTPAQILQTTVVSDIVTVRVEA